MKLTILSAAIALVSIVPTVQAHEYLNQVAQARDSLIQARDIYASIACNPSSPKPDNMATCPFANAINNGLKWLDEIKPSDTDQEAGRKIDNAVSAMVIPEDVSTATWNTAMVKPRHKDFAEAETLSMNVSGYLGLLFRDPKIHTEPAPTLESIRKLMEKH